MLYLSATGIKDFLDCPKRLKYRKENPESAVINNNVIFGGIVHSAIELFDSYDDSLEYSLAEWHKRKNENSFTDKESKPPKSFRKMLKGYYEGILPQINPDGFEVAQKEVKARHVAPFDQNIMLIGKFDRIQGGKVWDWKTSMKPPDIYDLQDFQFYFYDYLYSLIYNIKPEIYYGYLYGGSVHRAEFNETMRKNTINIIKDVAQQLYANTDHRITGYQCRGCFYKGICYNEMVNELDNRSVS